MNLIKHIVIFLLICIHLIYGSKIKCNDSEYNNYKDWDCSAILYYFAPLQVQNTLYCIDYIKESSPMHPQKTQVNMTRKVIKFVDVIDDSREIVFSELLKFYYTEPRLTFKNCLNKDLALKSNDKTDDFSDFLWIPKFDANMYSSIKFHTFGNIPGLSTTLLPVSFQIFIGKYCKSNFLFYNSLMAW